MTTERVHFRLIQTPCCSTLLCYVNPRLPNYCSECGKYIFAEVKGCILNSDDNAFLKYNFKNDLDNPDSMRDDTILKEQGDAIRSDSKE